MTSQIASSLTNSLHFSELYDNMLRLKAVERGDIVGLIRAAEGLGVNEHIFEEAGVSCPRNHISALFVEKVSLTMPN